MAAWIRYIFCAALLFPAWTAAQPAPDTSAVRLDTTLALPNLTVEAARERLRTEAAPLRVTSLDAADIAATGAHTAADLLEARTGLFVKRYGSGGVALPSLRGTNSNQTLVLVDGYRMADPQTGQVDLSLLPTVLLEGVDVVHGAGSARYGSGSMGGVVRLHTLEPTSALRIKSAGAVGAFGRRTIGTVASAGAGPVSGLAAVEVSRVENDFPYVNETLRPPQAVRRAGADRALTTVFGKVNYQPPGHHLSLTIWHNDAERGLPGSSNASSSVGARQWDTQQRVLGRYRTHTGIGTVRVRGRIQHTRQRYVNPSTGTRHQIRTRTYGLTADVRQPIGTQWIMAGGLAGSMNEADTRGGVRRANVSAFARGEGTVGRLALYPALRLDTYASEQAPNITALSPRLGVNLTVWSEPGLHLKGSVGRAFRAPTFGERFLEPGGNPTLRAEHGWSADLGVVAQRRTKVVRVQAEATAFATRIRDQIVWHPSVVEPGVRVWSPSNVARVFTRGFEASLRGSARLTPDVELNGGFYFTHTAAEDRSDPATRAYGHQLRYVPREQLKIHAGVSWHGFGLDLSSRLVSRRFVTSDETQALPPYQVMDARLHYTRAAGPVRFGLDLTVENVFDQSYSIIRFYPMPPRRARMRLTIETTP